MCCAAEDEMFARIVVSNGQMIRVVVGMDVGIVTDCAALDADETERNRNKVYLYACRSS